MTDDHPQQAPQADVEAEQRHIDLAYRSLNEMFEQSIRVRDVAAHPGARKPLADHRDGYAAELEDASLRLCTGRLDLDGDSICIGRRHVHDRDQETVVVGWYAPAAIP
jgi:hypothetical protein